MAEFPALPLWTDAYLGDTMHLDATEHGAYLLLLMCAWRTSDATLPDDDRKLARMARCTPKVWARIRPTLAEFFEIGAGKWSQMRLSEEFHMVRSKRDSAAANGRASALKRKERHRTKRPAERDQSDQQNGNEPPTPTPTPISTPIEEKNTPPAASSPEDHLWAAGKAFLISRGVSASRVGGLIGKWKRDYGVAATIEAIGVAQVEPNLVDPVPFVTKVLKQRNANDPDDPRTLGEMRFASPC